MLSLTSARARTRVQMRVHDLRCRGVHAQRQTFPPVSRATGSERLNVSMVSSVRSLSLFLFPRDDTFPPQLRSSPIDFNRE